MDRHLSITDDILLDHMEGRLAAHEALGVSQQLAADADLQRRYAALRQLSQFVRLNYRPLPVAVAPSSDAAVANLITEFVEAVKSGAMGAPVRILEEDKTDIASEEAPVPVLPVLRTEPAASASTPFVAAARRPMGWQMWRYAAAAAVLGVVATLSFMDDKPAAKPSITGIPPLPGPAVPVANNAGTVNRGAAPAGNANSPALPQPQPGPNENPPVVNKPEAPTPEAPKNPAPTQPNDSVGNPNPNSNTPKAPENPKPENPKQPEEQVAPKPQGRPEGQDVPGSPSAEALLMQQMQRAMKASAFLAMAGQRGQDKPEEYVARAMLQRGDFDKSGTVDRRDAQLLLDGLMKGDAGNRFGARADYNGDGKVDSRDYTQLWNDVRDSGRD